MQLTSHDDSNEALKAGGKPSTWLPPGGLVERVQVTCVWPTETTSHCKERTPKLTGWLPNLSTRMLKIAQRTRKPHCHKMNSQEPKTNVRCENDVRAPPAKTIEPAKSCTKTNNIQQVARNASRRTNTKDSFQKRHRKLMSQRNSKRYKLFMTNTEM